MIIPGNTKNWRDNWDSGRTMWDLGGPHPLLFELFSELEKHTQISKLHRWYVPGCGRAHDAAAIAKMGCDVTAVDIVDLAVEEAKKHYHDVNGLEIKVGDALSVDTLEYGAYDGIFDRAMMCAVEGPARSRYVEACCKKLRTGGYFISIPFAIVASPEAGPPFQISEHELRTLFGEGWGIQCLASHIDGAVDAKILEEYLFIAKKL